MGLVVTFAVAIILLFLAHKLDDADQMKALNALAANNKLLVTYLHQKTEKRRLLKKKEKTAEGRFLLFFKLTKNEYS